MKIGERILELRRKAGLSQEALAQELAVTRQSISKWESHQSSPDLEKITDMCHFFKVSYEYLIGSNPNSEPINFEHLSNEIDWSKAWSKKYPILEGYKNDPRLLFYQQKIERLYDECQSELKNDENTVLILKDMLYQKFVKATKKIN